MSISHRERFARALNHESVDRVPWDLGGTFATTLTIGAHEKLVRHLGMPSRLTDFVARRSQTVLFSEDLYRRLDTGTRYMGINPIQAPTVPRGDSSFQDEWGVTWTKAPGGHYIDTDSPLRNKWEVELGDIDKLSWPNANDPRITEGLRERALQLQSEDAVIIFNFAFFPSHQAQWLLGFKRWMEYLLLKPAVIQALYERIQEVQLTIVRRTLKQVGDAIDIVAWGDDLGHQGGGFFSPSVYQDVIKPVHTRMMETLKAGTKAKVFFHSCGAVQDYMPHLIDIGIEILNPVQTSATGMDPGTLSKKFGKNLVFWGGIDTQTILPRGTLAQVREEVRNKVDAFSGRQGGYVLSPIHNIQGDVPPENIMAMLDEVSQYM